MNTPAHLIIAAALYARPEKAPKDGNRHRTAAALLGGFLPDFSLYFGFVWAVFILGRSPDVFFRTDYYRPEVQMIMAIDNSVFVWGAVLGLALWMRREILAICATTALVHIALDFPLHNDDGRAHFWPLSDWVFVSPVSYWDPAHYGNIVAPLEALLCVVLLVVLFRRFHGLAARAVIVLAGLAQVLPTLAWVFLFDG